MIPIAFLVSDSSGVRLMQMVDAASPVTDNIIRTVPELIDKIANLVKKNKPEKPEPTDG